jgi:adenylosuccinate synthase
MNSVYQEFKGWKQDLTGMTTYEELPIVKKSISNSLKRNWSANKIVSVGQIETNVLMALWNLRRFLFYTKDV